MKTMCSQDFDIIIVVGLLSLEQFPWTLIGICYHHVILAFQVSYTVDAWCTLENSWTNFVVHSQCWPCLSVARYHLIMTNRVNEDHIRALRSVPSQLMSCVPRWTNAVAIHVVVVWIVPMDTRYWFTLIYFSFTVDACVSCFEQLANVVVNVVRAVSMNTRHWFTCIYFSFTVDACVPWRLQLTNVVVDVVWTVSIEHKVMIHTHLFQFHSWCQCTLAEQLQM